MKAKTLPPVLPVLVVHADWSVHPGKRWMTVAMLHDSGYRIHATERVGDVGTLIRRLVKRSPNGRVFLGVDFPLGIPEAYAYRAGISSFVEILPQWGTGVWGHFYELAETEADISVYRPFYPRRPGGKKQAHLVRGLGLETIDQVLKRSERARPGRRAACPMFWILGANQVGRAAIVGWRDVSAPAVADPGLDVAFWPFDGNLADLLANRSCVITEAYPAEACLHVGLTAPGRGWKKGSRDDRRKQVPTLMQWFEKRPVIVTRDMKAALNEGFGPGAGKDDGFDSLLGLLSMLEVLVGGRPDGAPDDPVIRNLEGWIIGMESDRHR